MNNDHPQVTPQHIAEQINDAPQSTPPPETASPPKRSRRRRRVWTISIALFILTCVSTFFAGITPGNLQGAFGGAYLIVTQEVHIPVNNGERILAIKLNKEDVKQLVISGISFSACLMSILFAHEMGHFLVAKLHGIPATPPFFIPMPFGPFGTMGAVILQDSSRADRRQLFDIAIAGPLAGLVVAIPVVIYGTATSEIISLSPAQAGLWPGPRYGDPLLVQWVVELIHGHYGPNDDIKINPALFAGWVGIFITALNLMPVGQLDGGHILYSMFRRKAHLVAIAVILGGVAWMSYTKRMDFALIVLLLLFFGPLHAPTANDNVPLGAVRYLLGFLTLGFIIIGFTPTPIVL